VTLRTFIGLSTPVVVQMLLSSAHALITLVTGMHTLDASSRLKCLKLIVRGSQLVRDCCLAGVAVMVMDGPWTIMASSCCSGDNRDAAMTGHRFA
jgi:hypothetical protein